MPGAPAAGELRPGHSIGRFIIVAPLGEGGMGAVYAAYDPQLDRKVAVKVIRSELLGDAQIDFRARLLREAQALARLSHPNVVGVYEAGSFADNVFFAMEFVEGVTLSQHLQTAPPWREVLSLFIQAGRGLAAAHAAGLVHRDFKPSNVVISKTGVARVLDFGLARPVEAPVTPAPGFEPSQVSLAPPSSTSPSSPTALTGTGVVMGTPGYMSPEQLSGQSVDARTDEFAFCVALFRALYDVHPYLEGGGQPVQVPRTRGVPARIYRVLKRGLARDPAERYSDMNALLAALEGDGSRVRRLVLVGALAIFAALTGLNVLAARSAVSSAPECSVAEPQARLSSIYGEAQRSAMERAFMASPLPYADQALHVVERYLDRYSADWARLRLDVCLATQVRHEQTPRTMELRALCLDRRLQEMGALVSLLGKADSVAIDQAVQAAEALRPLDECNDVRSLEWQQEGQTPARSPAVDRATAAAAEARAIANAEDPHHGLERALEALALARQAANLGTLAEVQLLVADLRERTGDVEGAEIDRVVGIMQADAAHRDGLRARALVDLALAVFRAGRPSDALVYAQLASAALARAGTDDALQARLHHVIDLAAHQVGRDESPTLHMGDCLELSDKALGRDVSASAVIELGEALREEGRLEESSAQLRRAIVMQTEALGLRHPDVGIARQALAATLLEQGNAQAAVDEQRAAVEIFSTAGPTSDRMLLGAARSQLARLTAAAGDVSEALSEQRRALATFTAGLPPRHPSVAEAWVELSSLQLEAGQAPQALTSARKARSLLEVDTAPAGLFARATLAEGRAAWTADLRHRSATLGVAHRVLETLLPRAPKDAAVLALAEWTLAPK
jgi:tetratricopeptide (TPR) repeat protein